MSIFVLKKRRLIKFLDQLKNSYTLIAPVKKDLVRFEKIKDVNDIYLVENPYFPIKEFFFKKEETLLNYDGKNFSEPKKEIKERIFFGIRKCDLNAIMHQDLVFMKTAKDPYYTAKRRKSLLIGYQCKEACSEYCFCGSQNLMDYFDLMFYDLKDNIIVDVGSEKGDFLIKKYSKFFSKTKIELTYEDKRIPNTDRLIEKDISKLYNHQDWKKGADICLSCGACTNLCPTCYCFNIYDEVKVDNPKNVERKRKWSSCQLQEFTRVAGNHVFREKREERFKHRIFHQLQYFKEKYNIEMCTGCGRCIKGCPTRIDFIKIINDMKKDEK